MCCSPVRGDNEHKGSEAHRRGSCFGGTVRVTQNFNRFYTEYVPLRLGLFGGTFDPPHMAHLVAAVHVRATLHLDEVVMMVAHDPYQKTEIAPVTPAATRLEMVKQAVTGIEGLRAGDEEIQRSGPSYTIDTVTQLREENPGAEIFVIIGEDTARRFHTWHRYEELGRISNLVVVNRSTGSEQSYVPASVERCEHVTIPFMDISSTDIRARVRSGAPIDFLVRSSVRRMIETQHLYVDHAQATTSLNADHQ